ncbi:iron complex outermembrane recepter protein [Chitinophaga sp. YR573]|uniref:SusC/RagA family TonB-linked outer membrane protein n=1 Tax=Chitinophaga sp. YR573 TaxID=1881040 RepID=UPI0008CC6720|nr:SusC/RagA family TonB-linked outer membrane protein [Chitinophaga sp. YR573]SEW43407.1 iron complex outermembrane recepter protein [Chitinophaga sp. YR573]
MQRSLIVCTVLFLLCTYAAIAQEKRSISGTVQDEKGMPLIGVNVQEKGSTNGTTTDAAGKFHLQAKSNAILVFSYIGFLKQEQPATDNITVKLAADSKGLNEVVVTAMGIKKEVRALGYAVSTISAKEITQTGSSNFASALYGKAAGVKIVSAPGGASSAVSVQVRGVSSVGLSTQPLYVVDGVPIRNYSDLTSGSFGTTNSRIDGNGALDINPEDIETLTILKGASASALYGSEATNGVVVITTKKGVKGKGLGVELNYIVSQEKLASSPDYQNEYGPGYDAQTNITNGIADATGWITDSDGSKHPYYRAYDQFGPKFDNSTVKYWDGSSRTYAAQKNNYKDFYETGYNSALNVAVSNASDKGSFRFSYTRTDYKGIMPGTNLNKNNFNFNGTLKLSNNVSVDLVSTYNNNFTHNRAYVMNTIFGSYGGFFSRFDDMNTYKNKYKTSDGYKYVAYNNSSYDQDEKLAYNIRATNILDYFWTNLRNSYDENQNRFINSATLNVSLLDNLKFRGRVGSDYTGWNATDKEYNSQPASLGYTGAYGVESRANNVTYGDALLVYSPKITKDLGLSATGGFTARRQKYTYNKISTVDGLVSENWFSLANSASALSASSARAEQLDVASFGTLDLNYKSFLYLEGTARYESTSTLPSGANSYFYPSFNAGFILSDVVKMPKYVDYAKLRASYGFVGNHPNLYQSNVMYTQSTVSYDGSNLLYQQSNSSDFGNEKLKSEKKREMEFGLETRLLHNKITVDFSYYNNKVMDQILTLSTAASTGSTSKLVNAGDISNYGYEAAISATPIVAKNFSWNTRFNFAINRNKLTALSYNATNLTSASYDGGYLIVRSDVGDALGNIYVHPRTKDASGNVLVNDNGIYTTNTNAYEYAGNIMPKIVGGFSNTFTYKSFALDVTLDYRFGGKLVSIPTYYQIGAGMYESTLQYRDAAHGGIAYNVVSDATAEYTAATGGSRNDGVILKGVTSAGTANTKVITAAMYYENNFDWETNGDYAAAVFNNSYIKVREVALTYSMPKSIVSKLHFQGLQLALIGRNLFYIYKTLPHGLDPEVAVGSSWLSQGVDGGTAGPTRSLGASLRARF